MKLSTPQTAFLQCKHLANLRFPDLLNTIKCVKKAKHWQRFSSVFVWVVLLCYSYIVHPKIKMISWFTHSCVIPNPQYSKKGKFIAQCLTGESQGCDRICQAGFPLKNVSLFLTRKLEMHVIWANFIVFHDAFWSLSAPSGHSHSLYSKEQCEHSAKCLLSSFTWFFYLETENGIRFNPFYFRRDNKM